MGKKSKQSVIIEGIPIQINMWDRLPGETDRPWDMFLIFRDLPPSERKLVRIAEMFGCNPVYASRACARYGWHLRAEAWDRHLDTIRQLAFQEETKLMGRRQARLAMKMQEVAQVRIDQIAADPAAMAMLTAGDVRGLAKDGVEIERRARGEEKEVGDERTIIVNFGTMIAAPKWAPQAIKDQFSATNSKPTLIGDGADASNGKTEEGTARPTTVSN